MARLTADDLAVALKSLAGWTAGDELEKTFHFADFRQAIAFVNRVADLAEAAGHHPDLDIRYNRVRVGLTTHDEGGITDKDTNLAAAIERAARP